MKLSHWVLPLMVCLGAAPATADSLTRFFPPDTKVVFGIRVHNLALSSVAQSFKAQVQAAGAEWLKLPLEGFDLLRDVDEVLLATNGRGQHPAILIVVTGRFDVARLSEGAERYHDVALPGGEKDRAMLVALLDGATALIGNPDLVRAAIDQRGGKPKIDAALNDRITSLRQRYDVWGLGQRPEGFADHKTDTKVLESIDRFQFGIQLANGLELGAEIHARSAEDAGKLSAALETMGETLKAQQTAEGNMQFDLQAEGSTLKLDVSMREEELKRTILAEIRPVSGGAPVTTPITTPPAETPVTAEVPVPEAAPEIAAAPPQAPPAPPEPPVAAPAPPPPVPPTVPPPAPSKSARAQVVDKQVVDKEGNTVILTLPGKK